MCFLSPRATLQISRQNDIESSGIKFAARKLGKARHSKTAAALLGRVGGMAGGTAGTAQFLQMGAELDFFSLVRPESICL